MSFLSRFAYIIKDNADLASGEILAMGVIACCLELLAELRIAVDPTHQVAGGCARGTVGEIELGKLLFAVTTDFHFYQKLKLKSLYSFTIIILSKITPSLFTIKEGSTAFPKPFSPQGTRDVAGYAIASPEFWSASGACALKGWLECLRNKVAIVCAVLHRLAESLLGMLGVTMENRGANAERYDSIYGTYEG